MSYIIISVLILAMLLATWRFIMGPTASDRVVALDTIGIISTAGLVYLAVFFDRAIYLDVALIYGVLGFIGVLTVARYLEGGL